MIILFFSLSTKLLLVLHHRHGNQIFNIELGTEPTKMTQKMLAHKRAIHISAPLILYALSRSLRICGSRSSTSNTSFVGNRSHTLGTLFVNQKCSNTAFLPSNVRLNAFHASFGNTACETNALTSRAPMDETENKL